MSSDKPLVTIGLPFLNPGEWVKEAIQSIFVQSYVSWELIALDDGSTDGTAELLRRINDPRVRIISDGRNLGLPARLNQITELASGKYIARMDADDMMHPMRLERQVAVLEANPQVDVVATGVIILDRQGALRGVRFGRKPSLKEIFKWGGYTHASIVGRREWFLAHPYSTIYKRAEDRELFVRTARSSNFAVLEEPLYFYRWADNVRVKAFLDSYASERAVFLEYGPELLGWWDTLALLSRSYLKSGALLMLRWLGKEQMLSRRHFLPIEDQDLLQEASEALRSIRAQKVPGWYDQ